MKESGILEMNTVVVGISEPIEASITTTLIAKDSDCLLYTSPSPRDAQLSRMPSSA